MSGLDFGVKILFLLGVKKFVKLVFINGIKCFYVVFYDDEDEYYEYGIVQIVLYFDKKVGGVIDYVKFKEEKKLFVIQLQLNWDWKEVGKCKRQWNGNGNVLLYEVQCKGVDEKEFEVREVVKKFGFGLNIYEKKVEDVVEMEEEQFLEL